MTAPHGPSLSAIDAGAYNHQRMEVDPWGWVDTLRVDGTPQLYIRDPDGNWWDAPVFAPQMAFSAAHKADELDHALASRAERGPGGAND